MTTDENISTDRYVYVKLARCPRCDSTGYDTQHSRREADESKTQYRKCRKCGHNYVAVWE